MDTDGPITRLQPQSAGRLVIFDTTLRDGEQAPGCSMTAREKQMVRRLQ